MCFDFLGQAETFEIEINEDELHFGEVAAWRAEKGRGLLMSCQASHSEAVTKFLNAQSSQEIGDPNGIDMQAVTVIWRDAQGRGKNSAGFRFSACNSDRFRCPLSTN